MSGRQDRAAGLGLIAAGLAGVFAPLALGRAARREVGLEGLDDRILADIGLDRAAIARARRTGAPLLPVGWFG